jgi:hypothetical protein
LASLHVNVARTTIHATKNSFVGINPTQTMVGFSLTFTKEQ